MTKDAKEVRAEREGYLAFLRRRIPELHEEGKPEPERDEKGRIKPGRLGKFPGRLARDRADAEWAKEAKER